MHTVSYADRKCHGESYAETIYYIVGAGDEMKNLRAVAEEINAAAAQYRMGQFQEIRRKVHGLSRVGSHKIFTSQTIHKEWAFHSGGRKEFQFNIGFEGEQNELLRYGLAFSLETSQTLPDPLILKPKVLKLNEYIRKNQSELDDIRFWYYFEGERSSTLPVTPISEELIRIRTFLFWGKFSPRETTKPKEVLFLFDRLLDIYEYVEGKGQLKKRSTGLSKGFQFKPGCSSKAETIVSRSRATEREVALRHNRLQTALHSILSEQYGEGNVGTENDTGRGSRVDLVVREGKNHLYYEIKNNPCIRTCLREALAQLIEYAYWPGGNEAQRLVVVSENPMTRDARRFLLLLRKRHSLPIYYQHLDLNAGTLSECE